MPEKIQCSAEVKVNCSGKTPLCASANCSIESNASGEVTCDGKSATVAAPATAPAVTGQVPEPASELAQKLLDRLYDCRKIEIEHLWQRSVFLGTFIVLAFSGYGMLVGKMLEQGDCGRHVVFMEYAHLVGMSLGCILFWLGVLWICMAKGSKRWQQVYENKIKLYENKYGNAIYQQFYHETEINLEDKTDLGKSGVFFSLEAGSYSPSRINILLGWFISLMGIGIYCCHCYFFWEWQECVEYIISIKCGLFHVIWYLACACLIVVNGLEQEQCIIKTIIYWLFFSALFLITLFHEKTIPLGVIIIAYPMQYLVKHCIGGKTH